MRSALRSAVSALGIVLVNAGVIAAWPARSPAAEAPPASLTPVGGPAVRWTGPKVVGVGVGSPVLIKLTATGDRPIQFAADGLPDGLVLDPAAGRISGRLTRRGTTDVRLTATNGHGGAVRTLRIVAGDRLSLTPAMGWNPFNRFGVNIDDAKVRAGADAMIASGLADHGYSYVNLDEGWEGPRAPDAPDGTPGPLQGDPKKFPDMAGLARHVHARGLRFGVYSTPRVVGYQGYTGGSVDRDGKNLLCSEQDVRQFAAWGVDYLKYDGDRPEDVSTAVTAECCRTSGRDVVYSLSNNSGCDPSAAAYYAQWCNSWRSGYDLSDAWTAILHNGFVGHQDGGHIPPPGFWAAVTGPGRWLDADMLVVGQLSAGGGDAATGRPCMLSPDEQYVHVTQWCMLASPLMIGCDVTAMDPFTLGLLTNDELLDVDQDALGLQATPVASPGPGLQVWARELEDGGRAVALYNLRDDAAAAAVAVNWADLGLRGAQVVRDLWQQRDLGTFDGTFRADVPRHGVVLLKVRPAAPGAPSITAEPADADAVVGHPCTLSLTAAGGGPLHYAWSRDGKPIAGEGGPTFTIPSPTMADAGATFRCTVSNSVGHVVSYEAALSVTGGEIPLTAPSMTWVRATAGFGTVGRDRSVLGNPIRVGGRTFERGLGTHAPSEIVYRLGGRYDAFRSTVGLDHEEGGSGSVSFQVFVDGEKAFDSGTLRHEDARAVDVDVRGKRELRLVVTDGGDGTVSDHADWADARLLSSPIPH